MPERGCALLPREGGPCDRGAKWPAVMRAGDLQSNLSAGTACHAISRSATPPTGSVSVVFPGWRPNERAVDPGCTHSPDRRRVVFPGTGPEPRTLEAAARIRR